MIKAVPTEKEFLQKLDYFKKSLNQLKTARNLIAEDNFDGLIPQSDNTSFDSGFTELSNLPKCERSALIMSPTNQSLVDFGPGKSNNKTYCYRINTASTNQ